MNLAEQYEQETGSQADSAGYPTIGYVQWLETKVQEQPPTESLKEAAKEWATKEVIEYYYPTVTRAFIAGAEWAMQNAQKPEVSESVPDLATKWTKEATAGCKDVNLIGEAGFIAGWHECKANFVPPKIQDIEAAVDKMLLHEVSGCDGWWDGWEALKAAYGK